MRTDVNNKSNWEDWSLLIIFLLVGVTIIAKSFFNVDGYLSPDSTSYLKCAQNLLDGNGYYYLTFNGEYEQGKHFFASWPVGYPTLIFLFSKLTGLSVFWASKALNIVFAGILLGVFRVLFKKDAYLYGLILLFAAYIEIFSYTWSETFFITALVWFCTSIYFLISNKQTHRSLYFSIMLSSLLLFLSRYIGAFSFGLIGLLGIYYGVGKKDKSKFIFLIGIAVINIGIMIAYLYLNYLETGFATGMQRLPAPETNTLLFIMLVKTLVAEMLIPLHHISKSTLTDGVAMFSLQFSIIGFILYKYRENLFTTLVDVRSTSITLSLVFGVTGLTYIFFIILTRWMTHYSLFYYRLIAPGTFLLFIAIIYYLRHRSSKSFFNAFKTTLVILSIFSFIKNVPYEIWNDYRLSKPTYYQNLQAIDETFSDVKKNSIVIFGSYHLGYLNTQIIQANPQASPYATNKEKWSDFLLRVDPDNNYSIYLFVPEKPLSPEKYDQSVIEQVNSYNKNTLVKIR